jgi:Mn-dependent DtxR family transcriptional regulator
MSPSGRRRTRRPTRDTDPPAAGLSMSTEDYLERISELIGRKGYARVVDIATTLDVSQPSVTAMVQRLAEAGYVHYERYRGLVLTERGGLVAQRIRDRHATLQRFFSLLQLDEQTQERDIEGLEHSLSAATVDCLTDLTNFLASRPDLLDAFLRRRKSRAARRR